MNETLEKIYQFAARAHGEQRRKYVDEIYINHPVRVMELCQLYNKVIPISAAALLHDVLEDTDVTVDQLQEFLSSTMAFTDARHTMMLVKDLTDVFTHEAFPEWNRRIRKSKEMDRHATTHPDAQTIKYADIIDNTESIAGAGDEFAPKFLNECKASLKKMRSGNRELYKKAEEAVDAALYKISEP